MARLKGLPERTVIWRHAVPNAIVPAIQVTALQLAWMAGGVVVVEFVFPTRASARRWSTRSANRDMPVVQAVTMLAAGDLRRAEPAGRHRARSWSRRSCGRRRDEPSRRSTAPSTSRSTAVAPPPSGSARRQWLGHPAPRVPADAHAHRPRRSSAAIVLVAVFGAARRAALADRVRRGARTAARRRRAAFGTDALGRDVLSRFLYGGRTVLWLSAAATLLGVGVGTVVGLVAAYSRGWVDDVLMRGQRRRCSRSRRSSSSCSPSRRSGRSCG